MKRIFIIFILVFFVSKLFSQSIYSGGEADGFSYGLYAEADNPMLSIYSGSTHDGFSYSEHEEADNPQLSIYYGGDADGFSWLNHEEADNPQLSFFSGGDADGFSWLNYEEADNPQLIFYSGGQADGFAWLNFEEADNPQLVFYSGGQADGFAWMKYEEADNPMAMIFSGGQADGFAWENYNLNFSWEGDVALDPNNWFNPGNWSPNAVPTITDDIEIPVVVSGEYPEISGAAESKSVIIYSGASTTINTDGSYTTGGAFVNDGTFTMLADASGRASFIDNGTISGTGTNTIQTFMSGAAYHYVSSPIECPDTDPLSNATSDLFTAGCSGFNSYFYTYDESYDLDSNPLTAPGGAFDPDNLVPGWTYAHGGAGSPHNLKETTGYAHYDNCDKTVNFIGIPNTGTFNYNNLSYTNNDPMPGPLPNFYDGWHLVSNPYPSSIDWDAVSTYAGNLDDFDNAVYVWKGDATTGAYEEYVNGISGGTGLLNRYVPPGQAFFVHATTDNADFQIKNSFRAHSTATYLKNSNTNDLENLLKLQITKNGINNYTTVYFTDNSTTEFDGNTDAFKLFGAYSQAPQIYQITPEQQLKLGINAIPTDSLFGYTIPLGIRSINGGNAQISVNEITGIESSHIYLEDLLLDSIQSLRNSPVYDFNLAAGDISDRLQLVFIKNNAPLIIETIADTEIFEDSLFIFSVKNKFSETDLGDSITLSATLVDGAELPDWLNFSSAQEQFYGTPLNQNVGNLTIKVTATDLLNYRTSQIFNLEIINTNDAPVVQNNIPDQVAETGVFFEYQIPENTFFDEDLGDSLSLSMSSDNVANEWLFFDSETNTIVGIPVNAGTYEITITAHDLVGATVYDDFKIKVTENSTYISENNIQIELYPNPTTDFFRVESGTFKVENVEIVDVTGKIIDNLQFITNNSEIDVSGFPDGIYFVKIQTENGVFVEKLIKE